MNRLDGPFELAVSGTFSARRARISPEPPVDCTITGAGRHDRAHLSKLRLARRHIVGTKAERRCGAAHTNERVNCIIKENL
jgi:hypothetical protein